VQMGYARWVDPQRQHIEVLHTNSSSHRSHVVTQKPKTLAQSDFEQVTTRSHSVVTSSHSVVTPADGECSAQPEPMDCMPVTPPAADSSRRREEAPRQTPLPPDALAEPSASSTSAPEEKKTPVTANNTARPEVNGGPPTSKEEDHISEREWNSLLNACCEAGVPNWRLREVVSHAAGIPLSNMGTKPLTRAQYQRALRYLANYREGSC
jgi:hypothetical protein